MATSSCFQALYVAWCGLSHNAVFKWTLTARVFSYQTSLLAHAAHLLQELTPIHPRFPPIVPATDGSPVSPVGTEVALPFTAQPYVCIKLICSLSTPTTPRGECQDPQALSRELRPWGRKGLFNKQHLSTSF